MKPCQVPDGTLASLVGFGDFRSLVGSTRFEHIHFIYFDETDFTARARSAGWRSVYVPQARMWHKVSATMDVASPITDYYMSRNRFLFLAKHLTGLRRARALAVAGVQTLTHVAAFTVKNHGGRRIPHRNAKLLALRDALLGRWGPMGADVAAACRPARR